MSKPKLSTDEALQLIAMYRDRKCLWDTDSVDYRNREARENALKEICGQLNVEGFGVREATQKLKSLKSNYLQEIRKIVKSNGMYTPSAAWFPTMHEIFQHKTETDETSEEQHAESSTCLPSVPKKRRHVVVKSSEQINVYNVNETEFDIWSKSLAKQLNDMEMWRSLDLQMRINNIISKERIAYEKTKSFLTSQNDNIPVSSCNYLSNDNGHPLQPEIFLQTAVTPPYTTNDS